MRRETKQRYPFEPDYAVAPGETLSETLESLGMKQRDLALRTGISTKTINEIVKGKAPITPDTAVRLERVTGVPARMWNSLEGNYREQLAKIADRQRLQADMDSFKSIPTKELLRRGVLQEQPDKVSMFHEVLSFFGVASFERWCEIWMQPDAAFRKSPRLEAHPQAVATWLRLGELQARQLRTEPYNKQRFRGALHEIRKLTTRDPEEFQPEMTDLAASAGVAVAFVPALKKCPVYGATRWLSSDKALIQLSLRYKSDDQFWFSFFHEAGHVLNDPKKEVFIDDGHRDDERERQANRFAANFLIPLGRARELPDLQSKAAVRRFARAVGIAPGIVVGRLQNQGVIPPSYFNGLKRWFDWKTD